MTNTHVAIRGRNYDLNNPEDLASIQAVLVSDNWPATPSDGVHYFLSVSNMLGLQLKRHLAANFKAIMKAAIEEGEEAGQAQISIGFGFTLDFTAPTVATISAHKLGFSVKHETKGKPQTHDLAQGEFLDEDLGVVLDVAGFTAENTAEPKPDNVVPIANGTDAEGNVTAESQPGDAPAPEKKPRKKRPKKVDPGDGTPAE